MAFHEEGGHRHLWVSNPADGVIYEIDLDATGIGESEGAAVEQLSLDVSENPSSGSVTFSGSGFGIGSVIEIYQITGRLVLSAGFDGTYTWDGCGSSGEPLPMGTYLTRVSDPAGGEVKLTLSRL